ncbi:hypothetical protein [Allopontixanthobacter confluentis]|uniref:hypothetical protein n=1 Tax=Allopontixanthobacter confluentis TaxID=1849021 RepID=UPI0019287D0C|nr:hypothetical protein [Allopontixanthobacter confluentis]
MNQSLEIKEFAMAAARQASAIVKKQLQLRDHLWPNKETWLWDRKKQKGFTTIPKTMPLILKIMDEITKGQPVSSTYLTLWCSTWDNSFAALNKRGDMANASGFGGQRGEHTWSTRMKMLHELQFIDIKPGKSGAMGYAIIWNPHFVIRWLHFIKTPGLTEASYNALVETAIELGAADMTVAWQQPHAPTAPTATAPPGAVVKG